MHSRICQIETHPVTEDDALYLAWNLDDIKPEIADYVDEDPGPAYTIAWLKENLANRCGDAITILEDGFILHEGFREAYFQRSYEKFQKYLRKLENCTCANFAAGEIGGAMFELRDAYNCRFGDYVWSEDSYLETRDEFMRHAKPEVRYYFGGTLDYHW